MTRSNSAQRTSHERWTASRWPRALLFLLSLGCPAPSSWTPHSLDTSPGPATRWRTSVRSVLNTPTHADAHWPAPVKPFYDTHTTPTRPQSTAKRRNPQSGSVPRPGGDRWFSFPGFGGIAAAAAFPAVKGDTWCGQLMCVTAYVNESLITYSLHTNLGEGKLGWMAIGFGESMINSPMVILWPNSDKSITISQRSATGHSEPRPVSDPPRTATVYQPLSSMSSSTTTLSFTIPPDPNPSSPNAATAKEHRIIWALSLTNPKSKDSGAKMAQHAGSGSTILDLTSTFTSIGSPGATGGRGTGAPIGAPTPTNTAGGGDDDGIQFILPPLLPYQRLLLIHAILCSVGFLGFLPAGVLVARWTRAFDPRGRWFTVHWILQVALAGSAILVGFAIAIVAMVDKGGNHFDDKHKIAGLCLIIGYILQLGLGAIIHWFKRPVSHTRAHSSRPRPSNVSGPGKSDPTTATHGQQPTTSVASRVGRTLLWGDHWSELEGILYRPVRNYTHAVFGLCILVVAAWEVRIGFAYEWPETTGRDDVPQSVYNLWLALIIALPICYTLGLTLLPKQLAGERRSARDRAARAQAQKSNSRGLGRGASDRAPLTANGGPRARTTTMETLTDQKEGGYGYEMKRVPNGTVDEKQRPVLDRNLTASPDSAAQHHHHHHHSSSRRQRSRHPSQSPGRSQERQNSFERDLEHGGPKQRSRSRRLRRRGTDDVDDRDATLVQSDNEDLRTEESALGPSVSPADNSVLGRASARPYGHAI